LKWAELETSNLACRFVVVLASSIARVIHYPRMKLCSMFR